MKHSMRYILNEIRHYSIDLIILLFSFMCSPFFSMTQYKLNSYILFYQRNEIIWHHSDTLNMDVVSSCNH